MKTNTKPNAPKAETKEQRYDPIQERAPDRDVTKAEAKATGDKQLSPRQQVEQQMEANNLWIAQHREDTHGVRKREAANAELKHKLLDMDAAAGHFDKVADGLRG